jgi:hypothetical protein
VGLRPVRFLGIRLARPESFDAASPRPAALRRTCRRRLGFDLVVFDLQMDEPLERCHEAILRCYHRFLAEQSRATGLPGSVARTAVHRTGSPHNP